MSHDTPRLAVIPGWVVMHPDLKGKDLQVLCTLGLNANRRHGWTRRSQVKIAEQLGCARSTVQASINRLVDMGAVERREVVSDNGRDSAHWYRLVYDAAPAQGYDFDAYQADEDEEFGPMAEAEDENPPAGIPAPPAGPESAPPAGPGPAPMLNTSCLTPPAEQARESARAPELEDRKKIERGFRRWWPMWPTMIADGEKEARAAWFALTADERAACLEKTPAYVAAVKALGRTQFKAASTYLSSKAWERLDDPKSDVAPPTTFNAFSKPWMALWLSELLQPVTTTGWPALTQFQQVQARDADQARKINQERKRRYGWPRATALRDKAERAIGAPVPGPLIAVSDDFVRVHRDSREAAEWRALAERMGWPWLPDTKHEWLYFPAGAPDTAMADLRAKIEGAAERASDDAA